MATVRLDKKGTRQIEKPCRRRTAAPQREFAYRANKYLSGLGCRSLPVGGTEFPDHNTESRPNRFIELCEAFLRNEAKGPVVSIREKEKL